MAASVDKLMKEQGLVPSAPAFAWAELKADVRVHNEIQLHHHATA